VPVHARCGGVTQCVLYSEFHLSVGRDQAVYEYRSATPQLGRVGPDSGQQRRFEDHLRRCDVLEHIAENTSDAHHLDRCSRTPRFTRACMLLLRSQPQHDRLWGDTTGTPRNNQPRTEISDASLSFLSLLTSLPTTYRSMATSSHPLAALLTQGLEAWDDLVSRLSALTLGQIWCAVNYHPFPRPVNPAIFAIVLVAHIPRLTRWWASRKESRRVVRFRWPVPKVRAVRILLFWLVGSNPA
jgi:hypothetical protein